MYDDGPDEEEETGMDIDMNVKINIAAQMSNDELRDAIKYAHEIENSMGTANPLCKPWFIHLEALLEIQRGRAAACWVDNSNPQVRLDGEKETT